MAGEALLSGARKIVSIAERQDRAAQLAQDKSFAQLPAGLQEARRWRHSQGKRGPGDRIPAVMPRLRCARLRHAFRSARCPPELILDHLQKNNVQIAPAAGYPEAAMNTWGKATLEHYLQANGWDIPTNHQEAENLAAALLRPRSPNTRPMATMAVHWHGRYHSTPAASGNLRANLRHGKIGDIDLKPFKSVLEYLAQDATFEPSELRHPQRVLDRLIQVAQGAGTWPSAAEQFRCKVCERQSQRLAAGCAEY